jgi:hypothetical protein
MRTTIASSEIFGVDPDGTPKRLTLAIGSPRRLDGEPGWRCRVAVVDVLRPTTVEGEDSLVALASAVSRIRSTLCDLREQGWSLSRDRAGREPIDPEDWPIAAGICETHAANGGDS